MEMKVLSRLKSSYKVESDAFNDVIKACNQLKKAFDVLLKETEVVETDSKLLAKISELKKSGITEGDEWERLKDELKKIYLQNNASNEEVGRSLQKIVRVKENCLNEGEYRLNRLHRAMGEQLEILEEQFGGL